MTALCGAVQHRRSHLWQSACWTTATYHWPLSFTNPTPQLANSLGSSLKRPHGALNVTMTSTSLGLNSSVSTSTTSPPAKFFSAPMTAGSQKCSMVESFSATTEGFQVSAVELLRCDAGTIPPEHYYCKEIALYSPVLVLYPEERSAGPPWRQNPADYHPRAVEIYLDHASARSTLWWNASGSLYLISKLVNAGVDILTRLFRGLHPIPLQDMLANDLPRGLPHITLDSGVRPGRRAWERYFQILHDSPGKYPRRCYVHVVRKGDNRVALQYWFFYYFNDYWNTHQTDFEVVTVFLRRKKEGGRLEPTACYFGAHRGGAYRPWNAGVWRVDRTHPIAFVGRGSHAFYAAPFIERPYIPDMPMFKRRLWFLSLEGRLVQTYWGDPVPDEVVPLNQVQVENACPKAPTYDVRIVPSAVECIRPNFPHGNPSIWNDWWWLRFMGHWGPGNWLRRFLPAQPGVRGPTTQDRWPDPWGYLDSVSAEVDWHEF